MNTPAVIMRQTSSGRRAPIHLIRVLFATLLALLTAFSVAAQTETVDISDCPTDTGGKAIVRLVSGLAFAIEPQGFLLSDRITDTRASKTIPVGCPENPIWTAELTLPFEYNALLKDRSHPELPFGSIELLRIFGHAGPITLQESTLERIGELRKRYGFCGATDDGLEYCHSCYEDKIRTGFCEISGRRGLNQGQPGWDAGTDVRAKVGAYVEFEGLPFAVNCRPAFNEYVHACEIRYAIRDGLSVSYRVNARKFDPRDILDVDRQLRAMIEAQRRPEYDGRDIRGLTGYGSK